MFLGQVGVRVAPMEVAGAAFQGEGASRLEDDVSIRIRGSKGSEYVPSQVTGGWCEEESSNRCDTRWVTASLWF